MQRQESASAESPTAPPATRAAWLKGSRTSGLNTVHDSGYISQRGWNIFTQSCDAYLVVLSDPVSAPSF
jgi:hypothetical protein